MTVVYMSDSILLSLVCLVLYFMILYILLSRVGRVPLGEMSANLNVVMLHHRPRLIYKYKSKCTHLNVLFPVFLDHGARKKRLTLPATGNAIVKDVTADK